MADILVVDDKLGIRELLSEILEDEGHEVTLVENAQQAREARLAYAPGLVLLDVRMPDGDGVTLLKEWKRSGLLTMPVIMMSGHATIDIAVEATRSGAQGFLEKPITVQKLMNAVQQGLSWTHELSRDRQLAQPHQQSQAPVRFSRPGTATSVDRVASLPARTKAMPAFLDGARVNVIGNGQLQSFTLSFELPLREARNTFERMYFEHLLNREEGSMTRVSAKAGLERAHVYRKLKQLGAEPGKLASNKQALLARAELPNSAGK